MAQPKDFVVEEKERMGCRLKKSINKLKQTSREWYLTYTLITVYHFQLPRRATSPVTSHEQ